MFYQKDPNEISEDEKNLMKSTPGYPTYTSRDIPDLFKTNFENTQWE